MAKNGSECALFVSNRPKTKNGPYLGLCGSNPRGLLVHLQPPILFSKPRNNPTRPLDPRTGGHLVEPEGSPGRAWWGPTVGPPGSPGRKKIIFSKFVPRPPRMLKKVFLARFELVVTQFGPWKIPKCLKNGLVSDRQKWVKKTYLQT